VAVVHARRCGWFSAQQYGMYLLDQARSYGIKILEGRVESVEVTGNRVQTVKVTTPGGFETISTANFVNVAPSKAQNVGIKRARLRNSLKLPSG
jgi:glycine/D-amino acid oxidase-like deaminating enzyme